MMAPTSSFLELLEHQQWAVTAPQSPCYDVSSHSRQRSLGLLGPLLGLHCSQVSQTQASATLRDRLVLDNAPLSLCSTSIAHKDPSYNSPMAPPHPR
ncbi:hypothetical protein BHE74_00026903 [Ensete ventricosum]|nr:hypothetical protein BHE74_00026903 [Ensete ventricosum]